MYVIISMLLNNERFFLYHRDKKLSVKYFFNNKLIIQILVEKFRKYKEIIKLFMIVKLRNYLHCSSISQVLYFFFLRLEIEKKLKH